MKVYLICRPCNDSYYDGHPTGTAFLTRERAEWFCKAECSDLESYPSEYDLYVKEVDIVE